MNITVITSEKLHEFPPAVALLQTLERLGHNIVLITPYRDGYFEDMQLRCAEQRYVLSDVSPWLNRYYRNRIKASLSFRLEHFLRRVCLRRIPAMFSEDIRKADVVWILNENTTFLGGRGFVNRLGDYMQTMYELHIRNGSMPELYNYAANRAELIVVPEYCRAHITRAFYGLEQMPAVIPNKPVWHPREKDLPISDPVIAKKIRRLEESGKKIIMYMGILSSERPLEPIIEAANSTQDYVLAVLGGRTPYLDRLEQKMGGRFEYLGEVKTPYHLEVASHADVAYISYVANNQSINAVFCAPNKVYEFAGFGIPMLCNDNPGLKFTVEYYGMGVCARDLTVDSIKEALAQIDANREDMGDAANRYYEAESIDTAVADALDRYMKIKERKHN